VYWRDKLGAGVRLSSRKADGPMNSERCLICPRKCLQRTRLEISIELAGLNVSLLRRCVIVLAMSQDG